MTDGERHLMVGRLRKPHGLKGSVTVFPLTDQPQAVFIAGQELWVKGLDGEFVGGSLVVEWGKPYHREWLLKFRGYDTVEAVEALRETFLSAPETRLPAPAAGEVYLHELEGFAVARADGTALGIVSAYFETPAGVMIEVQGPRHEFLLPFKKEFVVQVDREAKRLTVEPPDGLLED
jgi:16S rRNA processing protein RimM